MNLIRSQIACRCRSPMPRPSRPGCQLPVLAPQGAPSPCRSAARVNRKRMHRWIPALPQISPTQPAKLRIPLRHSTRQPWHTGLPSKLPPEASRRIWPLPPFLVERVRRGRRSSDRIRARSKVPPPRSGRVEPSTRPRKRGVGPVRFVPRGRFPETPGTHRGLDRRSAASLRRVGGVGLTALGHAVTFRRIRGTFHLSFPSGRPVNIDGTIQHAPEAPHRTPADPARAMGHAVPQRRPSGQPGGARPVRSPGE